LTVTSVTQPDAVHLPNLFRFSLSGTIAPGIVTVTFLDGSFADTTGISNVEATETFVVQELTAGLSNFANGGGYFIKDVTDLATGKENKLFDETATDQYFELTLNPVSGKKVDATTVSASDLTVGGVTGIAIISVEQIFETDANGVSVATNRFRFHYSVTGDPFSAATETLPVAMTLTMAEGAWEDTAGNTSAATTQSIHVRKPSKTSGSCAVPGEGHAESPFPARF